MKEQLEPKKDMNDFKIVIPMSDETINKIKSNAAKAVLGASIAGVMIAGGQSVKAQSVQEPAAVVQTIDAQNENDKKELSLMIDEILTSKEKKTEAAEIKAAKNEEEGNDAKEVTAERLSITNTSSDETQTEEAQAQELNAAKEETEDTTQADVAGQAEEKTEEKTTLSLDDFINNEGIEALFDADKIKTDAAKNLDVDNLDLEEEKTPEVQKAPEEGTTEPNYSKDEAKIKDYDEKNDYKKTDLQQGDTTQVLNKDDAGEEAKDGFKFETSNPSPTSESLTEYGYAIVIDKKTGQRTYTLLYVTDTGRIAVKTGNKPMMEEGDKLTKDSPDVTYKPNEDGIITAAGPQRNYEWVASEETLKHINDSGYTVIGMKDDYDQDNPKIKYFESGSFSVVYKVNPWPNENDKLELMELSGEYRDKVFVQGQEIKTNVKVDNMDENAKERIVGQVYNPVTGEVVPGASVYIDDEGYVHIKMPEGALKKDENGKYVVNEDSIFSTDDYKALQNLDVKFFARPRTNDEFTKIADDPYDPGTYLGPVAGTEDINHKGETVTIDKQGIDRYDHYNLIGTLKIDLDDTRYYNQNFKDGNKDDTSDITSSAVKPGVKFDVGIYEKDETDEFEKSADDMNGAKSRGEAVGVLKMDFIDKLNEGKAEEDQWKVIVDPNDISNFSIIAPKSAKAGDFAAIPVEYTYTNGSKDVHWFHFVVQESDNNLPSYHVNVDYPSEEMDSTVTVEQNDKKNKPNKYTIESDTYTDDQGNIWDVSINEATGEVTAKPQAKPDGKTFNGGEKLQVPVTVHYENTDETETAFAEFVLKEKSNIEPDYDAKAGKAGDKLESNVIVDDNNYDRKPVKYTLDKTTYTDNKGNTWTVSIDETTGKVTATVPNAEEGKTIDLDGTMITVPVTAHYEDADGNEIGTKKANVQFLGSGTKGTHKVTEEIPFEVEVRKDPNLKSGEWKYAKDEDGNELRGEKGEQEKTLTIVDSKVTETSEPTVTKEPKKAVILIGEEDYTGTVTHKETIETPFEVEYRYSNELEAGETKVIQKGQKGSYDLVYSQKIKNGEADGEATTSKENEKEAKKEIIVIGIKPVEKVVEKGYNTVYEYDENLEAGMMEDKTPGKNGKTTIKTSYDKENNKLVTEEKTEAPTDKVVKIGIKLIEEETELPFETEYVYDKDMEAGKTEVTQEGEKGKAKITTSFNKETGKFETKVERKEPTKKIVKYGSKTEGEVKIEHEEKYEVEIIYDSEMKAGEKEVVQEGKNGKSETTITIKNSKEVSRETKLIEKAQKKIIKVGTKNVCEIPTPDPEEPEKPVDPDNPGITEEPDKPGQEEPGNPGEEDLGKPVTPGTPDKPNTPGTPDTTSEGGTTSTEEKPSEDPKDPETKPETSVEKDKDPELNEETPVEKTEEAVENPELEKQNEINKTKQLPKTGDGMNRSFYGYTMGLIGSALLTLGAKKKKNDTVDEK